MGCAQSSRKARVGDVASNAEDVTSPGVRSQVGSTTPAVAHSPAKTAPARVQGDGESPPWSAKAGDVETVGDYAITKRLGQGTFAVAYLVHHLEAGTPHVVKRFKVALEDLEERERNEVRSSAHAPPSQCRGVQTCSFGRARGWGSPSGGTVA